MPAAYASACSCSRSSASSISRAASAARTAASRSGRTAAATGAECSSFPKSSSMSNDSGTSGMSSGIHAIGSDENIVASRAQHDLARLLELAHLRDDRRLRGLDVAHLHGAHELHLF